ncbi:hypothetical protein THRCLA_04483 [Thraustotheca clavata]|uniref:PHD-type domain-containing protein n=1 Tax=Thraustotheca clavata TaxID=74557 RepID=A0A1V9ZZ52_9STRA|nr:hypothetical protein THRCLA_04483 [Thraustotheca clavata]
MLKLGRGMVQMQYEPCESCGKSRVVALDNTAVPAAQASNEPMPSVDDMCHCKRRRVAKLDPSPSKNSSSFRRRSQYTYDPDLDDDEDDDSSVNNEDHSSDEYEAIPSQPKGTAYVPRCLKVRLRKVDDGYEIVPPKLPIKTPPMVIRLHRIGDGEYVALDQGQQHRKRRLEFHSGESDSSDSGNDSGLDSGAYSGSESVNSQPSSPVRKPHPSAAIPEGLALDDLNVAPWDMRVQGTNNRPQCESCGVGGRMICCERCPSVYHVDCLPMDHPYENVDPWWCPRCLQTPIGQQNKACRLCSSDGNLSQIILCDCCDDEYHLYCLSPPLTEVPSGDWFCPFCRSHNHVKRQCIKKKRKGRKKKRPLQFYYPSLLQETYEDLSILGRCRKFNPAKYGKKWIADDDRKLGNHQRKLRTFRDKVTSRNAVKPVFSKLKVDANMTYLNEIIYDEKAVTGMFNMVDLACARQRSSMDMSFGERAKEINRWRREWAKVPTTIDVYMRLLCHTADCLRIMKAVKNEAKLEPREPSPILPLKVSFGGPSVFAFPKPEYPPDTSDARLGLLRMDRSRENVLDPWFIMRMEALRIKDPMSLNLLLNSKSS